MSGYITRARHASTTLDFSVRRTAIVRTLAIWRKAFSLQLTASKRIIIFASEPPMIRSNELTMKASPKKRVLS
jgi:hypothetical protein